MSNSVLMAHVPHPYIPNIADKRFNYCVRSSRLESHLVFLIAMQLAALGTVSTTLPHFRNTTVRLDLSDTILSFSFPIPSRLPFNLSVEFMLIVRPKQILYLSSHFLRLCT
jgi:hypothetical protein